MDEMNKKPNGLNSENYVYVNIFDIPDVMKVRTQYKVTSEALFSSPQIEYDGIVRLAKEIQPFVRHIKQKDFGTDEYIFTDTLYVIPPDCKLLAIPRIYNEWILTSEQLPDDLEVVNITYADTDPPPYYKSIKDVPFCGTGVFYRGRWYWYSAETVCNLAEHGSCPTNEINETICVLAWMKLPKPYMEEQK